jgi:hypothetical protein
MSSHEATLVDAILYEEIPSFLSASIVDNSPDSGEYLVCEIDDVSQNLTGTHISQLPIGMLETSRQAQVQHTFRDDYYYRIHVTPQSFNLGAIVEAVSDSFYVWNAWFEQKTCLNIDEDNSDEYTLTGLTAPFNLNALEMVEYTLEISEEGSATFEATITFEFLLESPVVEISGTRLVVFPFEPLLGLKEFIEFLTNIIKSKDGSEQRISVRPTPRQGFKMEVHLKTEQQQAMFDALVFQWHKRAWGLPVWTDWVLHADTIDIDDTVIYLDTTESDFRNDSNAIIWQSIDSYEVIKVETVESDRLNLSVGIDNQWIGDKWIMPLRIAYMLRNLMTPSAPDGYAQPVCDFLVKDNALLTGFSAETTYGGLTVVTNSSKVDDMQETEVDADTRFNDYGLGDFTIYSDSDHNIYIRPYHFKNHTRSQCWQFREFLHSLLGRRNAFWVLSDKDDLSLVATIGSTDTNFTIHSVGLARHMELNELRTHIAFVFPDGTHIYRQITNLAEAGDYDTVTIDSALGVEVHVGDCEICFLDKVRLTDDKIEIDWENINENRCGVNLTMVKA